MKLSDLLGIAEGVSSGVYPGYVIRASKFWSGSRTYYKFLFDLARQMAPARFLELGTSQADGAEAMAGASSANTIITVDIDPASAEFVSHLEHTNIECVIGHSERVFDEIKDFGLFDVLFIDAEHTAEAMYRQYRLYRDLIKHGGAIILNAVGLNADMTLGWNLVQEPKMLLPQMHALGFGVAIKDDSIRVPSWEQVRGS